MNSDQIKYLQNYLRYKIGVKGKMEHTPYSVNYNSLEFLFEAVGIYTMNLICDGFPMRYTFDTGLATCGCSTNGNCKHKQTLKEYIEDILKGKDY